MTTNHKGKRKQENNAVPFNYNEQKPPKKTKIEEKPQQTADSNWAKLSQVLNANANQNKGPKKFNKNKQHQKPNSTNNSTLPNTKPHFTKPDNKKPDNTKPYIKKQDNTKQDDKKPVTNKINTEKTNNKPITTSKVNIFDPKSFNDMDVFYKAVQPTSDDNSLTPVVFLVGAFVSSKRVLWVCVVNSFGNVCLNIATNLNDTKLLPEQSRKLQFLHAAAEIPEDTEVVAFASLGKRVQGAISNKLVVTRDAADLIQLLMLNIAPKNKREFKRFPLVQDLDYYQLCKQYLDITRYPVNATIIDQARVLARVYTKVKKPWKQYLFERKTTEKDEEQEHNNEPTNNHKAQKSGKKKKSNNTAIPGLGDLDMTELMEEAKQKEETDSDKKKTKGPAPVMKQKKSRFVSRSERGSYWKYRPESDKRFGGKKKGGEAE